MKCDMDAKTLIEQGRRRVIVEGVQPEIEGGRFPIKRVVGETVVVQADVFTDGHDAVACSLLYRKDNEARWREAPMRALVNDRWEGSFQVSGLGCYRYTVVGWVDSFQTWRRDLQKRMQAEQDLSVPFLVGAELIEQTRQGAEAGAAAKLKAWVRELRSDADAEQRYRIALDDELGRIMAHYWDEATATLYGKELGLIVDRERARYSTWYELFPRSCATLPGAHGTFKDCEQRLSYVAAMGFDVLYLPPVHPIGRSHRKGKNNAPTSAAGEVGSPWAIGAQEGGHKAVHPDLGSLEDFRDLVVKAQEHGIDIALDIAFQCSPDHPYVKEHPQWFLWRPDGTVQYAENPPKKYQDIYPINFESEDWPALWEELKSVVLFWIEQGVHIFRVDNPHTKPFRFWEWLISEVKNEHPDIIFLAEAFTRPKVMRHLAKLGFSQSYTYFTWRNTKWELTQYFTELTQTESREYFRPNLWPNTPDILNDYLQFGGRPAFMIRLILAATLGASYGVYGAAFELGETRPRETGSEEYLDSEKYEIKNWHISQPDSLKDLITRVNEIRRKNAALQSDRSLRFHSTDNEQIIAYSKCTDDLDNVILVVVNLDPHHTQSGWIDVPLEAFDLDAQLPYQVHDLLSGARYMWSGSRNYVELNPYSLPAHIFRVRQRVRTEHDFDYYL